MKITIYKTNQPELGVSFELPYTVITDSFLDEELDTCTVEIKHLSDSKPFPRFRVAELRSTDEAKPKYFLIAADTVVTNVATGLSDHVVQLIEPTKWLERFMVGNKSVTQPLHVDYLRYPVKVDVPEQIKDSFIGFLKEDLESKTSDGDPIVQYTSPIRANDEIPIFGVGDFSLIGVVKECSCTVSFNGVSTEYSIDDIESSPRYETLGAQGEGTAYVTYYIKTLSGGNVAEMERVYHARYEICVLEEDSVPETTSLKDAALSMLCAAEILRVENGKEPAPRLRLNEGIAGELSKIASPEITVTNATLREALDEIGKCVDSITRLDIIEDGELFAYEVTFEKYCKPGVANVSELGDACEVVRRVSCEDYCTALDATVDNLVQYDSAGSIFDPSRNLWRTVRSEDASYRVTEQNAIIYTAYPIERIDSLKVCVDGGERDITEYVFEASKYGALSSYSATYPDTKALALCYTIGQRHITGLNFTMENPVHKIFEKPALVNIINQAFDRNYSNIGLSGEGVLDFTEVLFRVKYVPAGSARVVMRKPYGRSDVESILPYNQSSAKVSAKPFGKSMFGAALRMGNEESIYTYVTAPDALVPEKGERLGEDGYIAEVREEYAPEQKKVTLTVVDGFNRLSQFVGVDKSHRIFEIPERASLDRHIVYEDKCIIGRSEGLYPFSRSIVKEDFLTIFSNILSGLGAYPQDIFVTTRGYSKGGAPLKACILPCTVYGIGNALLFSVGFEDNYSAGRRTNANSSTSGKKYYETETDVRYTDNFGRLERLAFSIHNHVSFEENDGTGRKLAAALPEQPVAKSSTDLFSTGVDNRPLFIDKDAREAIKTLTYQISFLGEWRDGNKVVISPNLASAMNFFTRDGSKSKRFCATWIFQGTYLDNTTEWVTVSEKKINFSATSTGNSIKLTLTTPAEEEDFHAAGWAVYDPDDKNIYDTTQCRFLFGENMQISSSEESKIPIYFNFYH